ncbi:MAG: hypothetical protein K2Q24_15685 [Chitinophagaceae bacterium]|jgi:hypothetical protein|nr:hypothetical protein [Chitinophagaceae bacterium]
MKKNKLIVLLVLAGLTKYATAQNVGIGTTTPQQKLHVKGNVFVTDSLGLGITIPEFKLDVQGSIRIRSGGTPFTTPGIWFNDITNSSTPAFAGMVNDTLLGFYGTGFGDFGFVMATNTGNVGIANSNPAYKLDVNGRMRIRSGGADFTTPGIWLNDINNLNSQAFIGMANNNQVGFYGKGLNNFGLLMNTDNGEILYSGKLNMATQLVTQNFIVPALSSRLEVALCPVGYKVISGGGGHYDGLGGLDTKILFSGPTSAMDGWAIRVNNSGPSGYNMSVSCICAKIK